jgi:hypothetical protein
VTSVSEFAVHPVSRSWSLHCNRHSSAAAAQEPVLDGTMGIFTKKEKFISQTPPRTGASPSGPATPQQLQQVPSAVHELHTCHGHSRV